MDSVFVTVFQTRVEGIFLSALYWIYCNFLIENRDRRSSIIFSMNK